LFFARHGTKTRITRSVAFAKNPRNVSSEV
jgi:hypothetical protein